MSLFKKLSQINKDIEILEEYGDLKSANILHKKFIREAQRIGTNPPIYPESSQNDSPRPKDTPPPQDPFKGTRFYNLLLNDLMMNYNNSNFDEYYKEYQDNLKDYPLDEQTYLNSGVKRVLQQRAKENLPNPPGALAVAPKSQTSTPTGPRSWVANTTGLTVSTPGVTLQTIPGSEPGAKTISPFETLPKPNYTGDAYNPNGYIAPSTEGQGIVAGDPVTKFEFKDTSEKYNPKGYEINNSSEVPTTTPTPGTPETTPGTPETTTETPLTEEQKREEYYRKSKEEATKLENKAVAARMKPIIVSKMKNGDIQEAQDILTDYESVFSKAFFDEIKKVIIRMKPETYKITNNENNRTFTKYLYRLMRNQNTNAFNNVESLFDRYSIEENDRQKFIYFRNNLKDITPQLFAPNLYNSSFIDNLPS